MPTRPAGGIATGRWLGHKSFQGKSHTIGDGGPPPVSGSQGPGKWIRTAGKAIRDRQTRRGAGGLYYPSGGCCRAARQEILAASPLDHDRRDNSRISCGRVLDPPAKKVGRCLWVTGEQGAP